jgi:LPXTG-motif cell wall-anchored protein
MRGDASGAGGVGTGTLGEMKAPQDRPRDVLFDGRRWTFSAQRRVMSWTGGPGLLLWTQVVARKDARMKKLAVALVMVGAIVVATTAPAQASYNNGNSRAPTMSATVVTPGGPFTVTVGCLIGESIVFTFQGNTITVTCANNAFVQAATLDGTASATFNAPTAAGTYTGTVDYPAAPTETFSITVQAVTATTSPTTGLPATGSDSTGPTMVVAAFLVLAGIAMFGVAQHRRRASAPAA